MRFRRSVKGSGPNSVPGFGTLPRKVIRWISEHRTASALLGTLVPVAACLLYVRLFGVSVVFGDQWEMVTLFGKGDAGTLALGDFFRLHNEHRFFFPRLLMYAIGSATDWNNVVEMYAVVLLISGSVGIMFLAFRKAFGSRRMLLFLPIAAVVLTLRQHTNLLWGYQITFALTQFSALACLYLLHSYTTGGRRSRLPFAVIFAVVASGSSVQGLLVWIVGLIQIAVGGRPHRRRTLGVWSVAGTVVWVAYFLDYRPAGGSPDSPTDLLGEPLQALLFWVSSVGASLSFREFWATTAGFLLIASFGAVVLLVALSGSRDALSRNSFWISAGCFSLDVLALITLGRGTNGMDGAMASRYTTFSVLLVASVYALAVGLWLERRGGFALYPVIISAGIMLGSQALYLDNALARGFASERDRREVAEAVVEREDRTDEELFDKVKFGAKGIRARADTLERLEYNVFSDRN